MIDTFPMIDTFLGEPVSFWVELKKRADKLEVNDLLRDLAELSARVHFYEMHIDRMEQFRNRK